MPPTPAVVPPTPAAGLDEGLLGFLAVPPLELLLGLVETAGLVTVTVAVFVVVRLVFSVTVTVAVNVILSPEAADFGTETLASTCGVPGFAVGIVVSQLVALAQPTVKVGALIAGVLSLGLAAAFTVPLSPFPVPDCPAAHAEIVNVTVPPACTLLSEAATARLGAA
jgi:hypothetical protein